MNDGHGSSCAILHGGQILLGEIREPNLGSLMPLGRGKDHIFTSGMRSLKKPALHLQRHLLSLPQLPIFFHRKVGFAAEGAGRAVIVWDHTLPFPSGRDLRILQADLPILSEGK